MDSKKKIIPFDWFKLLVFIGLILLLVTYSKAGVQVQPNEDFEMADPTPTPRNSDGGEGDALNDELPIISELIKATLPTEFTVEKDESGVWHIQSNEGDVLYYYDEEEMLWNQLGDEEDGQQVPEEANTISCPYANPTRISGIGDLVRVVNAEIPLRESPKVDGENFIAPLIQDTVIEVIGEAVCTPFLDGANIWWLVRTTDGNEGYAAEGSAISTTYYLELIN